MTEAGATAPDAGWRAHLRGHLLRFEQRARPVHSPAAGARLLLLAAALEILRLVVVRGLSPLLPLWALVPPLAGLAVVLAPAVAGVPLSHLGLRRWSAWTTTEKSYFLQVMLLALAFLLLAIMASGASSAERTRNLVAVVLPYLCFGFYQELVYRGFVQTELVRRWGQWPGIVGANLLYTFGPLHANYYHGARPGVAVPMFASIFLIGLFFGVLYRRSGNLWLVGCFHAVGNAALILRAGSLH